MEAFDRLTPRGRVRRLGALARVALGEYGLGDARLTLAREAFNTIFRVDAPDGRRYALRVGARERIHPPATEEVMSRWLDALRRDTDIAVQLPITNQSGDVVTRVAVEGVPETRACVLFEWIPGRQLRERVDAARARDSGVLLARLHEHGAALGTALGGPPPVLVADRALSFTVADLVPRSDPVDGTLFAEALDRAQRAIDGLWARPPHPAHLLHGDFHPNNVLAWRGRLTVIDFQDLIWGFEVQDVAITVFSFELFPEPERLLPALRAGYETVRPWPATDGALLRDLVAGRHLSVLNLGFNLRRPNYDAFVERHTAWLRNWMQSSS